MGQLTVGEDAGSGTTIVGGQPRSARRPSKGIPVGVEQVLYAAAVDDAFCEELLADREAALDAREIKLRDSELAMLRMVPAEQLRTTIAGMDTSPENLRRRAFLGAVAAGSAVVALGACSDPVETGIRPDSTVVDLGPDAGLEQDGPPPVTGIRPDYDAGAPTEDGPEVSSDSVEPADLGASFGLRPGD
jgi:hypothetical protein